VEASELEEPGAATEQQYLPLRKVVAVGIGNALEFYDFITFSLFAIQIGHCFFPESQTSHGLLYALATFGVGFLTRPLGGVVIDERHAKAVRPIGHIVGDSEDRHHHSCEGVPMTSYASSTPFPSDASRVVIRPSGTGFVSICSRVGVNNAVLRSLRQQQK